MIPHDTIDTLIECFEAISALGTELDEDDWDLPTDLPAWTVKDNLSHLIGTERTLQGHAPTEHRAAELGHVKNPIGTTNEHEVDMRRPRSGEEVLAEWNAICDERIRTLRSADDAYFDAPAMTPTGPGTVADFLHIRVLDCWLHEQDMRRAVNMPGHLSGRAAAHTVDRLLRTVPIVVGKRAATPEGRSVALHITGGVERHLICEVRDGRAVVVGVSTEPPLCEITLDTEAFIVLATGRRPASRVAAHVSGDAELGQRVLDQFNMMI